MKYLHKSGVRTLLILTLILAIAGFATYFFVYIKPHVPEDSPLTQALTTSEDAAGFTDMEGNKLTLSDYFGDILVVSSWASWCPQCATDLPKLTQLSEQYKDRGIVVLAINRAENKFTAERFLKTIESTGSLTIILDPDDHFFVAHEGYAMPETLVYNKRGEVVLHQRGELRTEELVAKLDELLAE